MHSNSLRNQRNRNVPCKVLIQLVLSELAQQSDVRMFRMKSHVCYQSGDDGVQKNGADLIKERSCGHEIPGFHDDRRQNDREE